MARTHSDAPPAYRKTSDGHAAVTLFDVMTGHRKEFRLGRHGTKESRRLYEKSVGEWLARGRRLTASAAVPSDLSVTEALDRWLAELDRKCRRPDGTVTKTVDDVAITCRYLSEMFGTENLSAFGADHLERFRDRLIADGRVCPQVNKRISQCRQWYRWCVGRRLIPPGTDVGRTLIEMQQRVKAVAPGQFGAKAGK